ncbi:transposable element Tcb2 transposase [Trichonephila clavipes]|uniref:Transposable element Tcb2 transposase n=1 Tax=Trichonephila clavipes TaxID=2585209 RepID=A0A8X7BKT8_TRICX|nr:transposable element Tcb2 transposase [Trichonephila clavipes]
MMRPAFPLVLLYSARSEINVMGSWYTIAFRYPHNQMSQGFKSGDVGGQTFYKMPTYDSAVTEMAEEHLFHMNEKVSNHGSIPITIDCNVVAFIVLKKCGPMIPPAHKAHQTNEVETLAYQLNEEAERTERPIRRLSKVMYDSTCADMQVDVMGECLSSIKHVVGTTSGCFYPRSNHWEVGGRPQCVTKFGIAHSIVSRLWRQFQTTGTAIRGFSSGRPRGTTPADDRYIVLQSRRNRRQTAGEIARHTTQATGRQISRFTVARRLHGGGLFARRPVRCVPLTPAHRRRRSLWCRKHRKWRDNDWGRVLFTDEQIQFE